MTATKTDRPAYRAYYAHLMRCRISDMKRCQTCLDLDRQASAEAWRRSQRKDAS